MGEVSLPSRRDMQDEVLFSAGYCPVYLMPGTADIILWLCRKRGWQWGRIETPWVLGDVKPLN